MTSRRSSRTASSEDAIVAFVLSRLVRNLKLPIKVLGDGELNKKLTVEAQKFSQKAAERITAVGGEAITVPAIK